MIVPSYLQSDRTYCGIPSLPVRGIRIRATERNQTLFGVTSAIANSADNLDKYSMPERVHAQRSKNKFCLKHVYVLLFCDGCWQIV